MFMLFCAFSTALSSFLVFLIQPLSAKALLPVFGGVPSVWNVCLVFFQGILLLAYFYAFVITKLTTPKFQRWIHCGVMLVGFISLPVLFNKISPQLSFSPTLNVLWLLTNKVSLPLFTLSATAPLIQYWFGQTQQEEKDPYFLYSASNVGSLTALLGFPFIFESYLGLNALSNYWSWSYGIFIVIFLFIICFYIKPMTFKIVQSEVKIPYNITWHVRLKWLLLSFAPSCLLISVTQYITTEIVSAPMLWSIPLAIYLVSFIIAFSKKPIINHQWMVREQVLFLIFPLICLSKITLTVSAWLLILFHMLGFFALVMVCIGELVARKPNKAYLTEFYLWLALGGFLGGMFTSLLAPNIFNGIYEYYFAFCLCVSLRPLINNKNDKSILLIPFGIVIVLTINYFLLNLHYTLYSDSLQFLKWFDLFIVISVISVILMHEKKPIFLATNIAILFFYSQALPGFSYNDLIWQSRNFFGVTKVYKDDKLNLHILMNGSTLHGVELLNKPMTYNRLTSYYKPILPIATLASQNKSFLHVAIAGLGTGLLGCHFRNTDEVTFFEIDPNVITIARDPMMFTYLTHCPPKGGIILGDARLSIAKKEDNYFDLIIIDVFSSDAIPLHLITQEALKIYLQKLLPGGILAFNISNRHVDLSPVLMTYAMQNNLHALRLNTLSQNNDFQLPSEWIVLTDNVILSKDLVNRYGWSMMSNANKHLIWTDDFSNILKVLK